MVPPVALRRSPTEPGSSVARRHVERLIAVALAGAIAFQVAQTWVHKGYELSTYGRSLWYVNYEFGFLRRGLAGDVLRRVLGRTPTIGEVTLVQNLLAVVMLALVVGLVVKLCRQRTLIGYATAGLVVVSPFGLDLVGGSRRPDQLAFILLGAIACWVASRVVEPVVVGLVAGVLLAATAFVGEAGPLVVGPWVVLVVATYSRARGRTPWATGLAMGVTAAPTLFAFAVLLRTGRAGPFGISALVWAAPPEVDYRGTVFSYLDDTLADSVGHVLGNAPVFSLVIGLGLGAVLWLLVRPAAPYAAAVFRWALPTRAIRATWTAGLAVTTAMLFALGFDWMRWITTIGFACMLSTAAAVAVIGRMGATEPRPPGSDAWFRPLPSQVSTTVPVLPVLAAAYLLAFPPLPVAIHGFAEAVRLVVFVNAPG